MCIKDSSSAEYSPISKEKRPYRTEIRKSRSIFGNILIVFVNFQKVFGILRSTSTIISDKVGRYTNSILTLQAICHPQSGEVNWLKDNHSLQLTQVFLLLICFLYEDLVSSWVMLHLSLFSVKDNMCLLTCGL